MRPCFAFSNSADSTVLSIYDEIGFWGVQAKDFIAELGKVTAKSIQVEINSPGGDVFAALAMYNSLRASGKEIVTKVMGVAASAASLIFMAGDKRIMPQNTFLMIHNPWSFAMGNADELRDSADTLDKIGASLKATYAARTGMDDEKLSAMLATDTWISADEAKADGFATEVADTVAAKAQFDMVRADLPEHVKAVFASKTTTPAFADKVVSLATEAGFETYASLWALKHEKIEDVQASIGLAREVKALCAAVKRDNLADGFIQAGKNLSDVRAALIESLASSDEQAHIDTTQVNSNQPTQNDVAQSAVKTAEIWAKRRNHGVSK